MKISEAWYDVFRKEVGAMIRARYEEMELGQQEVAEMIGQSQGSIHRIVTGKVRKIDTLHTICEELGMTFWSVIQEAEHEADIITTQLGISKYVLPDIAEDKDEEEDT